MQNILIVYYSGTGNTKYLVRQLTTKLRVDNNVDNYNIITDHIRPFEKYDLVILCYPIYAYNSPKIFETYLKKLHFYHKKYLIIKNSGEPMSLNDASSRKIIKIMDKGENTIISEYHLLMPYYIMFRHTEQMVKQMLLRNDEYLDYIIDHLYDKKNIKYSKIALGFSIIGRLQRLGAYINSFFYRVDYKRCTNCKRCCSKCIAHNIHYKKGHFKFGNKCQMCMNCATICPANAIKVGFLEKWKVNKIYNFTEILSDNQIKPTIESQRFLKYYQKYYSELTKILKDSAK